MVAASVVFLLVLIITYCVLFLPDEPRLVIRKRRALVIGISKYTYLSDLEGVSIDAVNITNALETVSFFVTKIGRYGKDNRRRRWSQDFVLS